MFELQQEHGYARTVELVHLELPQSADLDLVGRLVAPNAVIVIDEYEGVERGVIIAFARHSITRFQVYLTANQPSAKLLQRFRLMDHRTTALMYPASLLRLTAQ